MGDREWKRRESELEMKWEKVDRGGKNEVQKNNCPKRYLTPAFSCA